MPTCTTLIGTLCLYLASFILFFFSWRIIFRIFFTQEEGGRKKELSANSLNVIVYSRVNTNVQSPSAHLSPLLFYYRCRILRVSITYKHFLENYGGIFILPDEISFAGFFFFLVSRSWNSGRIFEFLLGVVDMPLKWIKTNKGTLLARRH